MPTTKRSLPVPACSTPARTVGDTFTQTERDYEVAARISAAIKLIEGYEDLQIGLEALDGAVGVLTAALAYLEGA